MFIYIHSVSKLQLLTLHCWLAMVRKIKNIDIIFIIRKVWRYQRRNNNHLLVNAKRNLFDSIILVELHHVLLKWLYQARKASAHVYISMGYWCFYGVFFVFGGVFVLLFLGGGGFVFCFLFFLFYGWIFRHWPFFLFYSYLTCYDSCVKVPVQKNNKWERIILQS